ncbi:MAG: DUF3795 domain-containing protein [Chloroflexota bacterium]
MSVKEIGCCGAYCKTCLTAATGSACRGCKLGYESGERDINRARCKIKVCCLKRGFETCANCPDYSSCKTIQSLYAKRGYKYGKYRESIEFIRNNGYTRFLEIADKWHGPYGKL